jgi:hypothetical protein
MLVVTAYAVFHRVLWTKPLSEVKGMAWGVRDDAISGKRLGLVYNQCIAEESKDVMLWNIQDREVMRKEHESLVNVYLTKLQHGARCQAEFDEALRRLEEYCNAVYPSDDVEA